MGRLGLLLSATAAVFVALVAQHVYLDNIYIESTEFVPTHPASDVVQVAYYSRAGSSEAVARVIASHFNAALLKITTKRYPLTLSGIWDGVRSSMDPTDIPRISLEHRDQTPLKKTVSHLFVVAPTWMSVPAPPLKAFLLRMNLKEKNVTLVTLGTGGKGLVNNQEINDIVTKRGGQLSSHMHFARGPHFWETTLEKTLEEVQIWLDELKSEAVP
eukprot:scaffold58497_cov45-Attheya_sp.AAC.3